MCEDFSIYLKVCINSKYYCTYSGICANKSFAINEKHFLSYAIHANLTAYYSIHGGARCHIRSSACQRSCDALAYREAVYTAGYPQARLCRKSSWRRGLSAGMLMPSTSGSRSALPAQALQANEKTSNYSCRRVCVQYATPCWVAILNAHY